MSVDRLEQQQWVRRLLTQLADTARDVGRCLDESAASVGAVPCRAYPTQARVVADAIRSVQRLAAGYELPLLCEFAAAEDSAHARRIEAALFEADARAHHPDGRV